jgi:DNA-binding SARP family transcriptional activator/tetratricopeptide (TPR) repeat protein
LDAGSNPAGGYAPAEQEAAVSGLRFGLLGPLEVRAGDRLVPMTGRRRKVVLLMLLLEPGRIVPMARLVEALWDDHPPKTAETQVQICVSQIRNLLAETGHDDPIRTHPTGYMIQLPPEAIDMVQFHQLVARARVTAQGGDVAGAAAELRAALDLWRGDAAADVDSRLVQTAVLGLTEARLAATQDWIELEFELGRHTERIGELRELVAAHPLQERLRAQLALALYRASRQAEALTVCRDARRVLVEEHGIDPGPDLRQLERRILENDPGLSTPVHEPDRIVPQQLPAPPVNFVGRTRTVAEICARLGPPEGRWSQGSPAESGGGHPTYARVIAISGPPGVGKTALAVHVAHQTRESFPDGQLYAHLRGSDAVPVPPEQVLNQFLRAFGMPPAALPNDLHALAAAYRSRIAGRRVLIMLDDAASGDQVRPLVPGDHHCALAVTSRQVLAGLPEARRIDLKVLDPPASIALLTQIIGEARVREEPEATSALAEACGHLPLALQVAAAKLSVKQHWRITRMAEGLSDERRRLDELTLNDVGVRPSIAVSYRALPPPAARLLLLLSALGATDFAGWIAGPLLEVDVPGAAGVLDELVEARLVEPQFGVGARARYLLHDLTRIFARELLAEEVPAPDRAAAQHRLLRCWLYLVREAQQRENGGDYMALHSDTELWPLPVDLVDELLREPMEWLQSEYTNLVSAVSLAAQLQHDELCWDLAVTSVTLFETRAYYESWRDTHEVAMEAVLRRGNARGEAVLRYSRGGLALAEKRLTDAEHDLERARAWFATVDDAHGQALTLRDLASVDRLLGRYDSALTRSQAALSHLRSVGDRVAEASVLRRLAQIYLERGRADEAEAPLRQALAICAEVGVRRLEAQVQFRLGQVLLARGRFAEAEAAFHAVRNAAERGKDVVGRANALLGLGGVRLASEDLDLARGYLAEALEAARRGGSRLAEGQILLAWAELKHKSGIAEAALASLDHADAIFHDIGTPSWQARARALRQRVTGAD